MTDKAVEILLVEDNPSDVDTSPLRSSNLTNHIEVVRDGAEALTLSLHWCICTLLLGTVLNDSARPETAESRWSRSTTTC